MLGLKRRKRTEGWALDIHEANSELERAGLLKRLADSNKFWIGCLIGIILLSLAFAKFANHVIGGSNQVNEPRPAPSYFRNVERYQAFSSKFVSDPRFRDQVDEAEFLSPGRFRVVVGGTTSADEIDYISKMAAEMIRHDFNHKAVIQAYVKSAGSRSTSLAATTQWERKKFGYVVRLHEISQN